MYQSARREILHYGILKKHVHSGRAIIQRLPVPSVFAAEFEYRSQSKITGRGSPKLFLLEESLHLMQALLIFRDIKTLLNDSNKHVQYNET